MTEVFAYFKMVNAFGVLFFLTQKTFVQGLPLRDEGMEPSQRGREST